jgi:hypothetical protein
MAIFTYTFIYNHKTFLVILQIILKQFQNIITIITIKVRVVSVIDACVCLRKFTFQITSLLIVESGIEWKVSGPNGQDAFSLFSHFAHILGTCKCVMVNVCRYVH